MNGIRYRLRLLEPVLAGTRAGDANSARSLLYISGGMVRGALIYAYLKEKGINEPDAADPDFQRLFLSGETCYLHAYPMGNEDQAIPPPLSWKERKEDTDSDEKQVSDLARPVLHDDESPDAGDLRGVSFNNYWKRGKTVYSRHIPVHLNFHNQRDAIFGRAKQAVKQEHDQEAPGVSGAIYRYEALSVGLEAQGIILASNQEDTDLLKHLLENRELFLGKSRTAGYGRVLVEKLEDLEPDLYGNLKWHEHELNDADEYDDGNEFEKNGCPPKAGQLERKAGALCAGAFPNRSLGTRSDDDNEFEKNDQYDSEIFCFAVQFVSIGIVRDKWGQYKPDPLPALETRLGVKLKEKPGGIFRAGEIISGFNRTWGLPLPQVTGIGAGSVFVIQAEQPVSADLLKKLEQTGLGERRAEGFGRVMVHHFLPETMNMKKYEDKKIPSKESFVLTDTEDKMARFMLMRLVRQELDQKITETVQDIMIQANPAKHNIPSSQLARWRNIIRSAMEAENPADKLDRVARFFTAECTRRNQAWQKMYGSRITQSGNKYRLTEWIHNILDSEESPWKYMNTDLPVKKLGTTEVKGDNLDIEYGLRLIDAVLTAWGKLQKNQIPGGMNG